MLRAKAKANRAKANTAVQKQLPGCQVLVP